MSRRRLALACAAALAAGSALAFVRSTDAGTHVCLFWGPRSVTYRINVGRTASTSPVAASPTCAASGDTSAESSAIQAAFSTWSAQTCTDLSLRYDPTTPGTAAVGYVQGGPNENTVVLRSGWCSVVVPTSDPCLQASASALADTCANKFDCFDDTGTNGKAILALTTVTYDQRTGEILDADMELNGWDGVNDTVSSSNPPHGWYYTCTAPPPPPPTSCTTYGQPTCPYIDLQNTVTHEAGHFIGLAHNVTDPFTTMYPTSGPLDFAKRTLAPDDILGLCTIYPKGAATVTCIPPHHGGCASGGEGAGLSALFLALAALAPRLRRRPRPDRSR